MRNLKTSFWVSCSIHLGVMAAVLVFATHLHPPSDNEQSPVIELITPPVEIPPKIIVAPIVPQPPADLPEPEPIVQRQESLPVIQPPPVKPAVPSEEKKIVEVKQPEPLVIPKNETIEPIVPSTISRTSTNAGEKVEVAPRPPAAVEPMGQVVSAHPRYRQHPEPTYPLPAKRRGEEGTVVLMVKVESDGKPGAVDIKETSGYSSLDDSAKNAVRKWAFEPARRNGAPISSTVEIPVSFRLSK